MKRRVMLLTLIILTLINILSGQSKSTIAEMTFEQLSHNFGTLEQGGKKVTHLFEFANTGEAPLVITRTKTSCRCISTKTPKHPIKSGTKGVIEVSYNPKDVGVFNKSIDIHANIEGGYITLFVTGEVK